MNNMSIVAKSALVMFSLFVLPCAVFANKLAPENVVASGQDLTLYHAQREGAEVKMVLRVVDQNGQPVQGARIFGGIQTGGNLNDNLPIRATTDAKGEYVIKGRCTGMVRCGISKEGYYASEFVEKYPRTKIEKPVEKGKWMPYGLERVIPLKKIMNPCQLVIDDGSCKKPPKLNEWLGYDLELNQWVEPHGKGKYSDMLVKICIDAVDDISDFYTSMEISFTNNQCAGAYVLKKDTYSEMKTVYAADTNETYKSSFDFRHERHPLVKKKPFVHVEGMTETDTRLDANSYIVFRTRTTVDEKGDLLSAHYGRLEGLLEFFGSMRAAGIFFNPCPNDTNLEDSKTAEYSRMMQRQREEALHEKKKRKPFWPF